MDSGGGGMAAIPIVGLSGEASTAVVVNLIFSSLWMGALGWELLMSVPFDYRLLAETRWRSLMSSAHSIAYLLSRYATLVFIALYVAANATTAPAIDKQQCERRVAASAVFFVISQSSIILIFVMRTLAIWNLDVRVVVPLTVAWLAMVGLELTMPIKANGAIISGFCTWSIDGFWVGASMTSLAIISVLCMVLTIFKLNKQGWRGVIKSVLPRKTFSIDSEEVSAMLVQRTTIFSIILVAVIAVAVVVYFSTKIVVYQLMTVTAYLAIASSLAGRIFRRSWKLTRSSYYQRPPSYFPEWVRGDDMLLDAQSQSNSHKQARISDDSLTFVEGEFRAGPASSAKSLILPLREKDKTPAQRFADQHGRAMSDGALNDPTISKNDPSYDDTFSGMPSQDSALRTLRAQSGRGQSEPSIYERDYAMSSRDGAPTSPIMVALDGAEKTWRISRGKDGSASRLVLPFGAHEKLSFGNEKQRLRRPHTDPTGEHQFDMNAAMHSGWTVRPATSDSPGVSPKQVHDTLYADEEADARRKAGGIGVAMAQREDLPVAGPSRSRLWLDSHAERARMEAATSLGLTMTSEADARKSAYTPSYASSSHQSILSSAQASRKDLAARRSMRRPSALSSGPAGVAPLDEDDTVWAPQRSREGSHNGTNALESSSASTSRPSTGGVRSAGRVGSPVEGLTGGVRRGSFLESPAIVQQGILSTQAQDRKAYDIDAIRQSLSTATQHWRPSTADSVTAGSTTAEQVTVPRPSLSLPTTPNGADADHVIAVGESSVLPITGSQARKSSAATQSSLRPSTAPDQAGPDGATSTVSEGRRGSAGAGTTAATTKVPPVPTSAVDSSGTAAADALAAFRQVVECDSETSARALDASRPRTSRGGPLGTFGELRRDSAGTSSSHGDEASSTAQNVPAASVGLDAVRPTTSDGSQMVVKPFGSGSTGGISLKRQLSNQVLPSREKGIANTSAPPPLPKQHPPQLLDDTSGISAIEQQYRKLAAYVEADEAAAAAAKKSV